MAETAFGELDRTRTVTLVGSLGRRSTYPNLAACALALSLACASLAGCSINRVAAELAADALADGADSYATENDPDLVAEALPFGLKTMEGLLKKSPRHRGLLLTLAKGFTGYAYLLKEKADLLDARDIDQARRLRQRALGLFLRGRDFGLRGLEVAHPGIVAQLRADRRTALARTSVDDVALLYWSGAAWAAAVSLSKNDLDLVAELPIAGALVGRVLDLDPGYDAGAAHEFFIAYEGGRPGGSAAVARRHYEQALKLSRGARASVYLALAENVVVKEQKLHEFVTLLNAALKIDPNAVPQLRLVNTIAQRRARWLKARIPNLFVSAKSPES